jgi:hypothetical protein
MMADIKQSREEKGKDNKRTCRYLEANRTSRAEQLRGAEDKRIFEKGGRLMDRNIMAYLQFVRENDPRSYGLGGIGGEANRLFELSDDDIVRMNADLHAAEVKGMLETFTDIAKRCKKSRTP